MSSPFEPRKVASQTEVLFQHAQAMYKTVEQNKEHKPKSFRCLSFAFGNMREAVLELEMHILRTYDLDIYRNNGQFEDRDIAVSGIAVNAHHALHEIPGEPVLSITPARRIPILFTGVVPLKREAANAMAATEVSGIFLQGIDINQAFDSDRPLPHLYVPFEGLQIIATAQSVLAQ